MKEEDYIKQLRVLRANNRSWDNRTIEEDEEFRKQRRWLVSKIIEERKKSLNKE